MKTIRFNIISGISNETQKNLHCIPYKLQNTHAQTTFLNYIRLSEGEQCMTGWVRAKCQTQLQIMSSTHKNSFITIDKMSSLCKKKRKFCNVDFFKHFATNNTIRNAKQRCEHTTMNEAQQLLPKTRRLYECDSPRQFMIFWWLMKTN